MFRKETESNDGEDRRGYFPLGSGLAIAGLHLAALSSLAVARQYFEPIAKGPDFFIVRGATGLDVLVFAFGLVLIPPAVLLLLEWLAGLVSRRLRTALHLVFVGGFLALIGWQFVSDPGGAFAGQVSPKLEVAIGMIIGGLGTLAYARFALVRSWLTVLSFAPAVVLALFLVFSPVRSLAFGGDVAKPDPRPSSGVPVVMVVFDELPLISMLDAHDRIDARRLPNFARLARGSTWYRNGASVADLTQLAVPAMLSGRRGSRDRLQVASEYPNNLFTLLAGSYRLNVWENHTELCPEPVCRQPARRPFGQRMRTLLAESTHAVPVLPERPRRRIARALAPGRPPPPPVNSPPGQDVRMQAQIPEHEYFDRFIRSLRPTRGRTLDFLHVLLPHRPWTYLPSGQRYDFGRLYTGGSFGRMSRDSRAVAIPYQRHLLQLGLVDRMLGRLLDTLERLGTYDRALVVVVADHGTSFRPGSLPRGVTAANVGEIAPVPMFVKAPGQGRGRVVDAPVQSLDVLAEMARLLRVRMAGAKRGLRARRGPLTVQRTVGGGEVRVARARLLRLRRAALRRNRALLDASGDPFAIGPRPDLAGRPLTALLVTRSRRTRATLDRAQRYRAVEPRASQVPADVSGLLLGDRARVRPIAIAVGGKVAVTAWSQVIGGHEYYTALVPPSAFRRGRNGIEVLELVRRHGRVALARLGP